MGSAQKLTKPIDKGRGKEKGMMKVRTKGKEGGRVSARLSC